MRDWNSASRSGATAFPQGRDGRSGRYRCWDRRCCHRPMDGSLFADAGAVIGQRILKIIRKKAIPTASNSEAAAATQSADGRLARRAPVARSRAVFPDRADCTRRYLVVVGRRGFTALPRGGVRGRRERRLEHARAPDFAVSAVMGRTLGTPLLEPVAFADIHVPDIRRAYRRRPLAPGGRALLRRIHSSACSYDFPAGSITITNGPAFDHTGADGARRQLWSSLSVARRQWLSARATSFSTRLVEIPRRAAISVWVKPSIRLRYRIRRNGPEARSAVGGPELFESRGGLLRGCRFVDIAFPL